VLTISVVLPSRGRRSCPERSPWRDLCRLVGENRADVPSGPWRKRSPRRDTLVGRFAARARRRDAGGPGRADSGSGHLALGVVTHCRRACSAGCRAQPGRRCRRVRRDRCCRRRRARGVFMSVTTIPAAADIGVSIAIPELARCHRRTRPPASGPDRSGQRRAGREGLRARVTSGPVDAAVYAVATAGEGSALSSSPQSIRAFSGSSIMAPDRLDPTKSHPQERKESIRSCIPLMR